MWNRSTRQVGPSPNRCSPSVTRTVINRMARQPRHDPSADRRLRQLTPREREVLELVARGLSNAEIATTLVVEDSTIKTHMTRVLAKLDLRDRVQAVVRAYETGLVQPGEGPPHPRSGGALR